MLEEIFTQLTLAMQGSLGLSLAAAMGWGILSILLSPCHLASIPLVIAYISRQQSAVQGQAFKLALVFALGILITIALIGLVTAAMGRLLGDIGIISNYFIGGVFILIGLYFLDILHWEWQGPDFGSREHNGILGALLLGLIFGIGLGPCTFAFLAPVLGVVFRIADESILRSVSLILAFGIGHCLVIVGAGVLTGRVQRYLDWSDRSEMITWIKRVCGILVIMAGIYLIIIL
jgi:cytochrome c-type biogenesis protein